MEKVKGTGKWKPTGLIAAACLMYAVSAGLRSVYGVMLSGIAAETGVDYAAVSFAIAVGQLVFGVAQPVFGIVAIKKSSRFVLALGSLCMAAGLGAIPVCRAGWQLVLFLGILLPTGTGAVSFGMIMGAITPKLGEETAAAASGLINACSGLGSIVFSPILQRAFSAVGLTAAMIGFALLALLLVPVSLVIGGTDAAAQKQKAAWPMIRQAFQSRNYLFLMVGFFTCGFHMAIIETHLYSQILSYGIAGSAAAVIFSLYGFATIAGSLISGVLCGRLPMKRVLAALYGSRVIWILGFLLLPKTVPVIVSFTVLLGLTGAATVTPTSGLVGKQFGSENLAALFGIVFAAHQLGSFLSTWLGGKCLEATGGYVLIWLAAAALSLAAMIFSSCIKENADMLHII